MVWDLPALTRSLALSIIGDRYWIRQPPKPCLPHPISSESHLCSSLPALLGCQTSHATTSSLLQKDSEGHPPALASTFSKAQGPGQPSAQPSDGSRGCPLAQPDSPSCPQSQLARGHPEQDTFIQCTCIHPSQRARGARRWPPGYLPSAWLPDTVSSLRSWPGIREPPGTKRKLILQDAPTLFWLTRTLHTCPSLGCPLLPLPSLGMALAPLVSLQSPRSPALTREKCLCPCPTASQESGAASPCPSLTPGAGTPPWPLGKKSHIIRQYIQSLTAEHTSIRINTVDYVLLQNLKSTNKTPSPTACL
ncbi:uncharacterized protein LOC111931227 [Cyanistes caeruleus]|uniref:uncharacterized protein LOC111931227 n=1 Tax=Cyanistes caeruleus TaxID=156563 RepID=UPI000CD9FC6F|nr:uncharacterized protein LOC111931227 [Cyanistes caeruleus]